VTGIHRALEDGERDLGISSRLIMCFLRHLSGSAALDTLSQAEPFLSWITAVGLDSSEEGNPPSKFEAAYRRAQELGLLAVAHAGEEGPPSYIWEALDLLGARRIDHGVRCLEDEMLVSRLAAEQVPLTVCPLSNVKLCVFPSLGEHNLPELIRHGLLVTINSDDPAYFGGYVGDNMMSVAEVFGLGPHEVAQLARNSFVASFLDDSAKQRHLAEIDRLSAASS
jgi:adenosine deaminase